MTKDERTDPTFPPLEEICRSIETAFNAGAYYAALAVTLSLPDICAALECEPGKAWATELKYTAWFEANAQDQFHFFTAKDCHRLRCGVLHQGRFGHPKAAYDRIIFTTPSDGGPVVTESLMEIGSETALSLDLFRFCGVMMQSVRRWASNNADNPHVRANIEHVVRQREEGLLPYFSGFPVIS